MTPFRWTLVAILVIVALVVVVDGFYVLDETETAHLYRFGKPVGESVTDAGIHWKMPLIIEARIYEARWIPWLGDEDQTNTKDKVMVETNTFCRWKIINQQLYQEATSGNEEMAQSLIDDIIDGVTRRLIGKHELSEILRDTGRRMKISSVGSEDTTDNKASDETGMTVVETKKVSLTMGRTKMEDEILKQSKASAEARVGVEIMDIKFIKLNYIEKVRNKVFDRMIAERNRAAEHYRSTGQGKKSEIEGMTERELNRITSEAFATAREHRGAGEAKAADIYSKAYSAYPGFYNFVQSLQTLEAGIDSCTTWYISTDGKVFNGIK